MGEPKLGQCVQLLQRVSHWLFAFLDKPREREGTHRSGTHCVSTHSVLMFGLVCACEKKKKLESHTHTHACVSMPCTKSQLKLHLCIWLSIMSLY